MSHWLRGYIGIPTIINILWFYNIVDNRAELYASALVYCLNGGSLRVGSRIIDCVVTDVVGETNKPKKTLL